MTPFSLISPYSFFTLEGPRVNRMLHELGLELVPEHAVASIETGAATAANVYTPERHPVGGRRASCS